MSQTKSHIAKGHALFALVVLVLINSVNFMDRAVVSVLVPLIQNDLGFSDTQMGIIGGLAFTLFYALMALPIGFAADRYTRKYVLSIGLVVWSVATFFSGLASSFWMLFAARAMTGTGESSAHPSGISLITDYMSQRLRAMAISIYMMGVPIGMGLGLIAGGILAKKYGWQMTFFVYAIVGLVLVPLVLLIKEPVRGGQEGFTSSDSERFNTESFRQKAKRILSSKTLIYHYAACMFIQLGAQGFVFWIPSFLVRFRSIDVATAGKIVGGGLLVGGLIGALGGAAISDYLFRTDKKARLKLLVLAGALSIPLMIATLLVTSKGLLILFLFLTILINISAFPILNTVIVDLVTPQDKGVAMALLLVIQTGIGLSFGPPLVGYVSDSTGSLLTGLFVAPVSVFLFMILSLIAARHVVEDYRMVQEKIAELKVGA